MQRADLEPAMGVVWCIGALGIVLTLFAFLGMRAAYHRAYSEIASSCKQVRLLTVENVRYFCAPVARVERSGGVRSRQEATTPTTPL